MISKVLFILVGIMAIAGANLVLQPISADDGITIETDSDTYNHSSMIILTGHITAVDQNEVPVTIMVISPNGNIATIAQVSVNADGVFSTTFNTAGNAMKYDGTYQIQASYGFIETAISIELTNAIESAMTSDTNEIAETTIEDAIRDGQINYTIDGGVITSFFANGDENSLVLYVKATDDGTYFVTVNSEESQDFEQTVNQLSIPFNADTEKITIFGGWAIPEFGTIAIMILVVAIVSIIALSAKTKLSIVPKY